MERIGEAVSDLRYRLTAPLRSNPVYVQVAYYWDDPELSGLLGAFVGCLFGVGVCVAALTSWTWFGLYLALLACFHFLEFFMTALFHRDKLSYSSYLLDHSDEYHAAMGLALMEYLAECLLWPSAKDQAWLPALGFVIAVAGQGVRTVAMYTAGRHFTHLVREKRVSDHELVTTGIYSVSRHPGYMGWFWFVVGTQIMLCNPITTALFAYAAWRFFVDRIAHEEAKLVEFFGDAYLSFRKNVPTGIPFIP